MEAKSIGAENTFARDIADADALRAELDLLSERVAARARADGMVGHTVNLEGALRRLHHRDARDDAAGGDVRLRGDSRRRARAAGEAPRSEGRALRLLGVSLSNLAHADEISRDLFDTAARTRVSRNRTLDAVMDKLRERLESRRGSARNETGPAFARGPRVQVIQNRRWF